MTGTDERSAEAMAATVAATAAIEAGDGGARAADGWAARAAAAGSAAGPRVVAMGRTTATRSFWVVAGASVNTRWVVNPATA